MKSDDRAILIARDIRLTFKLHAKAIYVSQAGEVTIVVEKLDPKEKLPELSADYLDAICSKFYYGGYLHQDAIADIMLLNSALSAKDYDDFYSALNNNLKSGNITVISSALFQ